MSSDLIYITMFYDKAAVKAAVESRKYKLQAETPRSRKVSLAKWSIKLSSGWVAIVTRSRYFQQLWV